MSQLFFPAKFFVWASLLLLIGILHSSTIRYATAQQRPNATNTEPASIIFALPPIEPVKQQDNSLESTPFRPGTSRLSLPNISQSEGKLPTNAFKQVVPVEHEGVVKADRGTRWEMVEFNWEPSEMFHRPLYFNDVMLERHGHAAHWAIQPAISGARFVTSTVSLPYNMTLDPPIRTVSTLGYSRAGSYTPPFWQIPPLRADASTVQAGVVTGLIFIIP